MAFSPKQHPIVLQIGGSNLKNLAKATQLANTYNYDEVNLKFVLFHVFTQNPKFYLVAGSYFLFLSLYVTLNQQL